MRNGRLKNRRSRSGFTLLELILVIVVAIIMGIYIFHRARLARQRAVAGVLADTGAIVKWNDDETVRSLVMTGMPVEQLNLKDIEQLVDLVAVNLDHSETEDRHLARLAESHTLKELYLVGTAISDEGCVTLGKLTDLEALDLRATFLGDEGLKEIAKLKKLKGLRVAQTWMSDAGMESIGSLHRLRTLDIRHTDVTDEGLIHLAGLTSLKRLRATGARVTRGGLDELKRTIPDLKVEWFPEKNHDLRVRLKPRNYLDPPSGDEAIHLSERALIKELRDLTKEYQGGNRNPNAMMFAANINQTNGFVRTLDLNGSKVTAEHVQRARWCRNLTHFRLWQTSVGNDAFACIHRNRFLERVFLADKTLSDGAMKQLAKLPNLHNLEIYNSVMTDKGMQALSQIESLQTVNIREVDLTDEGLKGWNSVALPSIRSLVIGDRGRITKEGVTRLVHDFPNGRVYFPKHSQWVREAQRSRPR
ncbi:MAG: hypothetical protein H8E37_05860 [Planctomycetes bacterium]|nr:hypothetical protein [Planctomycetota bacterium]